MNFVVFGMSQILGTNPPLFDQFNTPYLCRVFHRAIGRFSVHRIAIVYFLSLCKVEKEWSVPWSCLEQKAHQLLVHCMIYQNMTEEKKNNWSLLFLENGKRGGESIRRQTYKHTMCVHYVLYLWYICAHHITNNNFPSLLQ